jgi:hypothetical protein
MAKKKLTPEQEKEIKLLQANNEMLQRTKEEAKLRGTESSVQRIELAQQDVYEQVKKIDKSIAEKMMKENNSSEEKSVITTMIENHYSDESIFDVLKRQEEKEQIKVKEEPTRVEQVVKEAVFSNTDFNNIDMDVQYDVISLPSNGECYRNKTERVPVGYLTAYDENFITSPNLYKDGLVIDFLLKHKIMNKDINIDELVSGDVDAIILFLRATSYGTDFPIYVRDPESGEQIETVVDLSTLKYKEFTLKGDKDGYFDFELPVSKDIVKFRFLTRKDEKNLKLLSNLESESVKAQTIKNNIEVLKEAVKSDRYLDGKDKQELLKDFDKMKPWIQKLEETNSTPFNKLITNRLEMSIVAVNDNYDRSFITKYVKTMVAKDSLMLRRYILEHEPGVNFEIEVERPEILGGGSFKTFLEWDDNVFLNIA